MAKKAAEGGGGLALAAHGAAIVDFVRAARDYNLRVRDAHILGMKTLGMEPDQMATGADHVGDINLTVTGDLYGDQAVKALQKPGTSPPNVEAPGAKATPLWQKIAAATALLAGGAGTGAGLGYWFNSEQPPPPPAVQQPMTDTNTIPSVIIEPHVPNT